MEYKHFNLQDDPLIAGIDERMLSRLDDAREYAAVPFAITSGLRSQQRNSQLKGAVSDSAHLADGAGKAHAVDLSCENDHQLFCMVLGLIKAGFRRIGIYVVCCPDNPNRLIPRHVHVDDDETKPLEVIWMQVEQN